MKIIFNLNSIINTIGLFFCLILACLFLFKKKGNRNANIILSLFILNCISACFFVILYNTNLYYYLPFLININQPAMFLLGPLVFFYVKSLINIEFKKSDLLHLLPFCIYTIFMIPFFLENGQIKINEINQMLFTGKKNDFFIMIILPLILIQIIIYLIVIINEIKKHEIKIKQTYSSTEKINLAWIEHFIKVFGVVCIIFIPIFFLVPLGYKFTDISSFLPISISFAIFLIGYNAWRQPEIFFYDYNPVDFDRNSSKKNKVPTQKKQYISKEKSDDYLKILLEFMKKTKIYKDPEITLTNLADKLNIPRNTLSFIINEYTGLNFYDFINSYRIEEAKNILLDPCYKNNNILDIAYDSGFNSKSTFNASFKKFTNKTPKEYKKYFVKLNK
jgi:AraC-like DNA-binding protein